MLHVTHLFIFGCRRYIRNKFDFWNVHEILNTSGLTKGFALALQEAQRVHDSMNIKKIEFMSFTFNYTEVIYNL